MGTKIHTIPMMLVAIAVLAVVGCSTESKSTADSGVDTSTGPDTDTDTDADADTDGDTDSDGDWTLPVAPPYGQWAVRAGANGSDLVTGIEVGAAGSITVVGLCDAAAQLGDGDPTETMVTGGNSFVARYAEDGVLEWAEIGCQGDCRFEDMALLEDGSILVHGSYRETVTFGEGTEAERTLAATPPLDMFVARFNPTGAMEWISDIEVEAESYEEADCYPGAISAWPDGSSVIIGAFEGPQAVFAKGDVDETTLLNDELWSLRLYVARYDPDGELVWVKSVEGPSEGRDVVALPSGDCALTGVFSETAVFGPGEPGETELASNYGTRIFVARLDQDGALVWASPEADMPGGGTSLGARSIAAYDDESFVVTGNISGGMGVFGAGEPNETVLYAPGFYKVHYLARFDASGELAWANAIGATSTKPSTVTLLDEERVVVASVLEGEGLFAPDEEGELFLDADSLGEAFLAVYQSDGDFVSAELVAEANDYCIADAAGEDDVVLGGRFEETTAFWEDELYTVYLHSAGSHDAFVARYHL